MPRAATYAGVTNQDIINQFFTVDRRLLDAAFPDWIAELVGPGGQRRTQMYTGPRLDVALTDPNAATRLLAGLSLPPPQRRGIWLKTLDEARSLAGPPLSLDGIVTEARAARLAYLLVKIGHETTAWNDHDHVRDLGDRLRAAGLRLWGYHFVAAHRPDDGAASIADQARLAAAWAHATGVQGLALWFSDLGDGGWDGAWVGDEGLRRDRAQRYLAALRSAVGPHFPLALCGPALPGRHPGIPWDIVAPGVDVLVPRIFGDDQPLPAEVHPAVAEWRNLAPTLPLTPLLRAWNGDFNAAALRALEAAAAEAAPLGLAFWRWGEAQAAGFWDVVAQRPPAPSLTDVVTRHGVELRLNGAPYRFIGVNLRELLHYGNPRVVPLATEDDIARQLDATRRLGARVARVFLPHVSYDPADRAALDEARHFLIRHGVPTDSVPGDPTELLRAALQARLALVLELAGGPRDRPRPDAVRLLVALIDYNSHSGYYPPGDRQFFNRGGFLEDPRWYQGDWQSHYWPLAERMLRAFRGDPRIFAWEIGNELKLPADPALFINFTAAVAARIRQIDPTHLIGPGVISAWHCAFFDDALARRFYSLRDLDFVTTHVAGDDFPFLDNLHPGPDDDAVEARRRGYISHDAAIARAVGRPLIIEEAGYRHRRDVSLIQLAEFAVSEGAVGFMPWGFSAVGRDIGVGDNHWGLDDYTPHLGDFRTITTQLQAFARDRFGVILV